MKPDDPEQITIECSPLDFEATRDALEARGYYLTDADTNRGHLTLVASRKQCGCDLCRPAEE